MQLVSPSPPFSFSLLFIPCHFYTPSLCQSLQFLYPSSKPPFPFWIPSFFCLYLASSEVHFSNFIFRAMLTGSREVICLFLVQTTSGCWPANTCSTQFLLSIKVNNMLPRTLWAPQNHHSFLPSMCSIYDSKQ